jgi:hypothetical protein
LAGLEQIFVIGWIAHFRLPSILQFVTQDYLAWIWWFIAEDPFHQLSGDAFCES